MALDDDDVGTIDRKMWRWAGFAVLFGMISAGVLFWFVNRAAAQMPAGQEAADQIAIVEVTVAIRPKQTATPAPTATVEPTAVPEATATSEPTVAPSATATARPTKIPVTRAPTQAVRAQLEPMILPTVTPVVTKALTTLRVESNELMKLDARIVYNEAEMQRIIDLFAEDLGVELGNARGVRLLNDKVTVFADVIGAVRTQRHETVFQVSAENGQLRVTLERAVIDGYPLTAAKETLLLQNIATIIENELTDRAAGRTIEAIIIDDAEAIVTLR